jgi:hypothetical protein
MTMNASPGLLLSLYLKPHQQRHDDKNDEYGTSTPASYSCSTELELLRLLTRDALDRRTIGHFSPGFVRRRQEAQSRCKLEQQQQSCPLIIPELRPVRVIP